MADIAEMLQAQARIIPIRPDNRVKEIEKMADGSMRVTQHSGDVFTVSPGDELFQAFVVYSVLAEL